jgi:hypothetical protein
MSRGAEVTTGPIPIGQFVALVKSTLKRDPLFQHQVLKGEVSGMKLARSGHTYFDLPAWLGFVAVVMATINVIGGFMVTDRMLEMFKKKDEGKK